jgi:type VI secretion system protein ImpF
MAAISRRERLQPSLLDRLSGDEDEAGFSEQRLRESVKRDLTWLFNTTNLGAVLDLSRHPRAAHSVLNYGLPDLAGHTVSSILPQTEILQNALRQAIVDFEPRLDRDSIRLRLDIDPHEMSHNALVFAISADLWAEPVPLHVVLRTHIDLETGKVQLMEGSASERR